MGRQPTEKQESSPFLSLLSAPNHLFYSAPSSIRESFNQCNLKEWCETIPFLTIWIKALIHISVPGVKDERENLNQVTEFSCSIHPATTSFSLLPSRTEKWCCLSCERVNDEMMSRDPHFSDFILFLISCLDQQQKRGDWEHLKAATHNEARNLSLFTILLPLLEMESSRNPLSSLSLHLFLSLVT